MEHSTLKYDPRQSPLFLPDSDWKPYSGPLPRIRGDVGLDTETKDGGLAADRGPGWVYNDGYVAGVSVAWEDRALYIPIRHANTECRSREEVAEWIDDIYRNCTVYFHSAAYDIPWLENTGTTVWPERFHDIQQMAVLINENEDDYSLDAICKRLGIAGKDERLLLEAGYAFGATTLRETKSILWRMPANLVGPYAEQDAIATLQAAKILLPIIEEQRLEKAYRTENKLIRTTVRMRRTGIRISGDAAEQTQVVLRGKCQEELGELTRLTGRKRKLTVSDINSPGSLQELFDAEGIAYPRTPKTKVGSFSNKWMKDHPHWLPSTITKIRQLNDLSEKFIGTYILGFNHRGRVHAEIHQLRDGDSGTRTYRLSYSNPPLQQMPARDEVLAPLIRKIFLPEEGEFWFAPDFSSQEPRIAVHFAGITRQRGADAAVEYFKRSDADLHSMVAQMADIKRSYAKIINLGLMYGMGIEKLAASLGLSIDDAKELITKYHDRVPWVRALTNTCSKLAADRGWIKLIDGARCRFDQFQPRRNEVRYENVSRTKEEWLAKYGANLDMRNFERSFTHKAMNRLVQGSAARQTKLAMVACADAGFYPLIQMHDELGFSLIREQDGKDIAQMMKDAVKLCVPVKVDEDWGVSWGDAKHKFSELIHA